MSALSHEQTSRRLRVMSVIPLKADIHQRCLHRLVPQAEIPELFVISVCHFDGIHPAGPGTR
jgi:hypothetical protein